MSDFITTMTPSFDEGEKVPVPVPPRLWPTANDVGMLLPRRGEPEIQQRIYLSLWEAEFVSWAYVPTTQGGGCMACVWRRKSAGHACVSTIHEAAFLMGLVSMNDPTASDYVLEKGPRRDEGWAFYDVRTDALMYHQKAPVVGIQTGLGRLLIDPYDADGNLLGVTVES